MKEVQDKHGDGYLGALANGKERFAEVANGNIRSGGFDLNGLWSPWYVLHKIYAGLRDAYRHTGNRTALELEVKFAAWAEGILANLSEAQVQRMLNTEFGGMNEILADLYADTGDKRWLNLSYRFEHRAMLDPLKRHQDNLAGKHGNTQVPKLMGSLACFAYTGDPGDGFAAAFFWDRVVQHHSYATGGHSKDEHFGEPDNPRRVAILWGPLVLAGDRGPESERGRGRGSRSLPPGPVPVFVAAERPVTEWLKPVPDQPGRFRSEGVGREKEVEFVPFYRLHRRTYALYWDLFTQPEWEKKAAELAAERERQRKLEAATVAFAQPGEMQPERDFNQQGEETSADRVMGSPARRGKNWFSFDLPVDPAHPLTLVVTYYSDEWRKRTFDVLIDGQRVGQQVVEKGGPPRFFDVEYAVPAELVRDKQKVTVRFQATNGNEIAAVFGIRTIRADAER